MFQNYRGSILAILNNNDEGVERQGIVGSPGSAGDSGMRSEFQYLDAAEFTDSWAVRMKPITSTRTPASEDTLRTLSYARGILQAGTFLIGS